MKTIYLLIGQKGSGKSFIGTIFEQEFGIRFLRVEDWARQIKRGREIDDETYLSQVFEAIEAGVRDSLKSANEIVFESTGLTPHFDRMLENLQRDFRVKTIYISAQADTCLARVKSRDLTIHIDVSDEQVNMINEKVVERAFRADFRIENENKSRDEIVRDLTDICAKHTLSDD